MTDYLIVVFFSTIGGVLSLAGAAALSTKKLTNKLSIYGTPFAAGALLAAVFLDLLPEGLEQESSRTVLLAALVGVLFFFIAERFLRWFHHHHEDDQHHQDPTIKLIVAGDTAHNALDGIAIAAAFLVSIPTGIVTTIAVAAHEIPQEIGDFGLLISKGMKRSKALLINLLSALATTIAAVITYAIGSEEGLPLGFLLGLSAGFLLYIALSDIIPTIHAKVEASKLVQAQTLILLIGVIVVGLTIQLTHGFIEGSHDHKTSPASTQADSHEEHHENEHDSAHSEEYEH